MIIITYYCIFDFLFIFLLCGANCFKKVLNLPLSHSLPCCVKLWFSFWSCVFCRFWGRLNALHHLLYWFCPKVLTTAGPLGPLGTFICRQIPEVSHSLGRYWNEWKGFFFVFFASMLLHTYSLFLKKKMNITVAHTVLTLTVNCFCLFVWICWCNRFVCAFNFCTRHKNSNVQLCMIDAASLCLKQTNKTIMGTKPTQWPSHCKRTLDLHQGQNNTLTYEGLWVSEDIRFWSHLVLLWKGTLGLFSCGTPRWPDFSSQEALAFSTTLCENWQTQEYAYTWKLDYFHFSCLQY